jgi:hypothetical protein
VTREVVVIARSLVGLSAVLATSRVGIHVMVRDAVSTSHCVSKRKRCLRFNTEDRG